MLRSPSEILRQCFERGYLSTSFQRAIRVLSPSERRRIESTLLWWAKHPVGITVAPNLRDREHFLPRRHMLQLLRVVGDKGPGPIDRFQREFQDECYSIQRKGGRVKQELGSALLGHAVDRALFVDHLVSHSRGYLQTPSTAQRFIDDLIANPNSLPLRGRRILLTAYNAWVTWNESAPTEDPFGFVVHGLADEVRACLGLDERLRGPLLLFRYPAPVRVCVYRPTIADAGTTKYFAPPIVSEKRHGYTRPWERLLVKNAAGEEQVETIPRPEGVHRPVSIDVLKKGPEPLP